MGLINVYGIGYAPRNMMMMMMMMMMFHYYYEVMVDLYGMVYGIDFIALSLVQMMCHNKI